ncbi:MAG: hypothetical protein DWI00_06645 [Planctomycetota bacterium]|nr:MAG: hypothetical protein DWI00_06645 [Planctomycetota bacterium]
MQQFVAFAVASAVLFTAGLIAGQGVDRSDETVSPPVTVSSPTTATDVTPDDSAVITEQETPDEPLAKPMPSPIMNASHQQQEEVTDHYFFSSVDGTANSTSSSQSSTDQTTETSTAQITVANPEARRQLESLILRMFPDAAAETVAAWADAYSDMDLGEVEFILEQKRSLSGSLDSEIATAMLGTPLGATTAESLLSPQAMSPIVEAQNAVRSNLQSAWSSGYRRTVVIPEAVSNQSIPGSIALTPRQVTMFRSFETGQLQPSPVPTHVAIASKNGALMFCLDGNLFTRRGDFQRLADGRLGLVTSSGSYALKDSTPIPESVTSIEITTSGEIMYDADGQPVAAGYVGIVELSELNRLQTVDGVFFTSETLNASSVPAANAELTTYQLEMSNVNRTDDTQLLELLNTELP